MPRVQIVFAAFLALRPFTGYEFQFFVPADAFVRIESF
jgi:hypothetical protein